MIKIRKSADRGHANHGWLESFHTFSFANYHDPAHTHFGNLRVINEDIIEGGTGFGKHPHENMEIITYIISGALSHQDSMGNSSTIIPGEVQIMSAGTGVFHSEFNHEKNQKTHLLQIWIFPKEKNIEPRYGQKSFLSNFEKDDFILVVSGSGKNGSLKINQDAEIFSAKFLGEKTKKFVVEKNRKVWIQMISGKLKVNETQLFQGDGCAIEDEKEIELKTKSGAEFLLFDL
jgi:redox-sensitive bicupin YhaK (pirin superfamily)